MKRSELVEMLNALPDIEVGTDDGTVVNALESRYDSATESDIPYIHLYVEDE